MKKFLAIMMAAVCSLAVGCSSSSGNSTEELMIVDLGSLMPTTNTTVTVDNPEVIQASKYVAEGYQAEYKKATGKDLKIEWATQYGRNVSDEIETVTQWYSTKISSGTCPVIGYTSLNYYQDKDWYIVLDEYLDKPNPYVKAGEAGSVRWKDMFYDYVWEDNTIKNVKGEIIALPIVLSSGTQTGVYYNKDLVTSVPNDWQEFKTVLDNLTTNALIQPYSGYSTIGLYQWALQFNLTPMVLQYMATEKTSEYYIDYDGDGELTSLEVLRGVVEGKFDPTVYGSPAQQVYKEAYSYYKNYLKGNSWIGRDYKNMWDKGQLPMKEDGIWGMVMEENNTARSFDYGVFPMPVADSKTFTHASSIEYYDNFDDIKCPVSVALNVMKPAVLNGDGSINQAKLDQAIDFLMYLTTVENVTEIAEEKGGTKGPVKGSGYNVLIDNENIGWKNAKFAKMSYSASWPTGFTSANSSMINKAFSLWVLNQEGMNEQKFYQQVKTSQTNGAWSFIEHFGIDTTGWNIKWAKN